MKVAVEGGHCALQAGWLHLDAGYYVGDPPAFVALAVEVIDDSVWLTVIKVWKVALTIGIAREP